MEITDQLHNPAVFMQTKIAQMLLIATAMTMARKLQGPYSRKAAVMWNAKIPTILSNTST
jgi:hypothetical protein